MPESQPSPRDGPPRRSVDDDLDPHEQERRLRALFAHSYQFMGLLDPDGTLLEANDRALAFVGASRADVIGRPFWDTPWWRGSEESRRRLQAAVIEAAGGQRARFQAEHRDKDDTVASVDFSLSPARDDTGRVEYLVAEGRDITDLKRAQEEARANEAERLASLLRLRGLMAAAAGVWEWDARTNECVWDERTRAIHGFLPTETPTFERWAASVHESDQARVFARLDAVRQTPGDDKWDMEFRVVHPDGTVMWTHGLGQAERDPAGHLTRMTGFALDITERKRATEQARAIEERFQRFVEATSDMVYSMRVDGQALSVVDFVAPAAERIYGRPRQAFFDNPNLPMELVHPDDQARVNGALERLFTSGQFDEMYRIARPDGEVRWLHDRAHGVRDESGNVVRIDGVAWDVTEQKVAEARLHAAETLSQNIIESAVDGIVVIDDHGLIQRINPSGRRLFGYEDRELLGQNIRMLMPPPYHEQHDDYLAHYRTTGEKRVIGIGREVEGRRKDGSTFPLFLSVSEMWLPEGRRFAGIVHDLTALTASEAEVERSHAALEARATELERQTHQLRRLASEVTLAEQRAREQLAKTLHDGLQQLLFSATLKLDRAVHRGVGDPLVERARVEVQDAIAAARSLSVELHPPVLRAGDLGAAVVWLADWMRERYGLSVRLSVGPGADPADDDVRALLFESVRELLFNAVKHAQVDRAAIELAVRGGRLSITVSDEGAGFDPAATFGEAREYHGGLGLAGIRERVTLLGGHLRVDSAPGRGTRFTLDVPVRGREPESQTPSSAASPDGPPRVDVGRVGRPLRILLVDDHALVREGLRELLTPHAEFEIVGEAADGQEALDVARTLQPDVVLMDVSMPGMDGVEATRRLRAELPYVRVIGLSTQEAATGRHAIEDAGAVGYITKATSTHDLVDRLRAEQAATSQR